MKFCKHCIKSPLPYLVIFMFSGSITFVSWLIIKTTDLNSSMQLAFTLISAIISFGLALTYTMACMNSHCSHKHHHPDDIDEISNEQT